MAKSKRASGGSKRSLAEYERKRDFSKTREPKGQAQEGKARRRHPRFSIQKHSATALHYDLRLEVDGVLASWAVPKGPSLNPADKRLAMRTEDHPLEYLEWEGVIPKGEYGAGPMIVWDRGVFQNISETRRGEPMELSEAIEGRREDLHARRERQPTRSSAPIRGRARRAGAREKWLLIKKRDEGADARRKPTRSPSRC